MRALNFETAEKKMLKIFLFTCPNHVNSALLQAVDPYDTGFIKSAALVRYAKSGSSNYREPLERPKTSFDGPVNELLTQVIGNNTLGEQ